MAQPLNTLHFVGDGDDVDIVYAIEDLFSITIEDHEADAVRTVGDLYELVRRKGPGSAAPATACFSQIAFHRLRCAMREMGQGENVRPSTPLAEAIAAPTLRESQRTWRELERRSGLTLPDLRAPGSDAPGFFENLLGALVLGAAGIGAYIALGAWAFAAAAAVVTVCALIGRARRTIPDSIVTVGDLCEEAAGRSFGALFAEKRSCHPKDVWFAIVSASRDTHGFPGPIDRDTTFFAEHARAH